MRIVSNIGVDLAIGQGGVLAHEIANSGAVTIEEGGITLPDLLTELWDCMHLTWRSLVQCAHPDQPCPEITEMDYGRVRGSLRLKVSSATAGYILRQWSVDCSPDHSLRGYEFRLWLKDHLALYGVKNAVLAPGYRSPDQNKGEQ